MSVSRSWCFTINNPEGPPALPENSKYIYQLEEGESKTPHYQGYVIFSSAQRLSALKKLIPSAHWEPRRGSHEQAMEYCRKEPRLEPTVIHNMESHQGKRNDLADARESLLGKRSYQEICMDPSLDTVRARYPQWVKETYNAIRSVVEPMEDVILRPWQSALMETLSVSPDSRSIHWVHDNGNTGKSYMASYLVRNHNAFLSSGGKLSDIALAYDYQPIVVFDLARSLEEFAPYQAMENFKDGRIFSSKYESRLKVFSPPHVVVFANFIPQAGKLTEDRIKYLEPYPFIFP